MSDKSEPIVLWRGAWHLTDKFGREQHPPLLTLCGRDVPVNATVKDRAGHLPSDICGRCLAVEQSR